MTQTEYEIKEKQPMNEDKNIKQAVEGLAMLMRGITGNQSLTVPDEVMQKYTESQCCETKSTNNINLFNTWAHRLMAYIPVGLNNAERIGEYNIIYHGDRLYSIRRVDKDAVVLLHADSPHEAWKKAVKMYE